MHLDPADRRPAGGLQRRAARKLARLEADAKR
jgi:hypothetical protein